jgi:hypothetical protein
MSKEAVIISVGIPPDHKTPDLKSNRWIYWKNRFKNKAVCFDPAGKTTPCSSKTDTIF